MGEIGLVDTEGSITNYPIPTQTPATAELPEHSDPDAIAQNADGNLWFTAYAVNNEEKYLIGEVLLQSGKSPQIKEYPLLAKENYAGQIAAGPEGDMWFTDLAFNGQDAIGRITSKGEVTLYPLETQKPSTTRPEYSDPVGIAQGPDGYMWFVEQGTNSERESFVGRIGTGISGTTLGKIDEFRVPTKGGYPTAIAQGPNGNMWFAEPAASEIGEVTPTGEVKPSFPVTSTSNSPIGIAAGPDGNVWFSEGFEANSIGRITPSGEVKSFPIPTRDSRPEGIVRGPDNNIWFVEQASTEVSPTPGMFFHIGRLTTPYLPASVPSSLPAISGAATEGQALTASPGSWTNNPGTFTYQWQDCEASGNNCSNLPGEAGVTHFLGAGDVGHTLRVVVTATNVAGSAAATSAPSAVVTAPAPPPPPPKVTPSVEASMTWTFGWTRKFTLVESLVAHGVPKGGKVEVVCHGHGCPFSHHASATVASHHSKHHTCHGRKCKKPKPKPQGPEVSLTSLFKGHHLGVGATISVRIVRSGWNGKVFVFTTRSNQTPHVQIAWHPARRPPGRGAERVSAHAHQQAGGAQPAGRRGGGRLLAATLAGAVVVGLAIGIAAGAATKSSGSGSATSLAPAIVLTQAHVSSVPALSAVALPALHAAPRPAAKAHTAPAGGASSASEASTSTPASGSTTSQTPVEKAPPVETHPVEKTPPVETHPVEKSSGGGSGAKEPETVHSGSGGAGS